MAKKVNQTTTAHEAIMAYCDDTYEDIESAIFDFLHIFKGKINNLEWKKLVNNAVSEVIKIKFADKSSIEITKFIRANETVRVSLKRKD